MEGYGCTRKWALASCKMTYNSPVFGLPKEWLTCVAYVKPFAKISCYALLVQNVVQWWYDHEFKLGTCLKYGLKQFPIGQIKKKSKTQKVKVWSNFEFK